MVSILNHYCCTHIRVSKDIFTCFRRRVRSHCITSIRGHTFVCTLAHAMYNCKFKHEDTTPGWIVCLPIPHLPLKAHGTVPVQTKREKQVAPHTAVSTPSMREFPFSMLRSAHVHAAISAAQVSISRIPRLVEVVL